MQSDLVSYQPENLNIKLLPHQLYLISLMEDIEKNKCIKLLNRKIVTDFSILGEPSGHGKTLILLGLILRNKIPFFTDTLYRKISLKSITDRLSIQEEKVYEKLNGTVIVSKSIIIEQWIEQIKKTPLSYIYVDKKSKINDLDKYDIVLVNTNSYNHLIDKYKRYCWKRFIFDECSSIKISAMKEITASFNWFISSKPENILSHHLNCSKSWMKKLFKKIDLDILKYIIIKSDMTPNILEPVYIDHNCIDNSVLNIDKLKDALDKNNIDTCVKMINGKIVKDIYEHIKDLYDKNINTINRSIRISTFLNTDSIDDLVRRRNDIEQKYKELHNKITNEKTCSICYEGFKNPCYEANCQNIFCSSCMLNWMIVNNSCPLCRHELRYTDIIYSIPDYKDKNTFNIYEEGMNIILSNKDQKILLYSSKGHAPHFSIKCIQGDISCICIDKDIKSTLYKEYNEGKINVGFVSSNEDILGIDLKVDRLILCDKTTQDIEKELIKMINRIGRTTPLFVDRLY